MTYYELWSDHISDTSDQGRYKNYVEAYYEMETEAYRRILGAYPDNGDLLTGTAAQMAANLGFTRAQMEIYLGFLDGIHASLLTPIVLEEIGDDTQVTLEIDYEKLFWNMLEAKADWLYKLSAWDKILSAEKRSEITREFRETKMVRKEKIGRNDPCPCGSGKKYKSCCM